MGRRDKLLELHALLLDVARDYEHRKHREQRRERRRQRDQQARVEQRQPSPQREGIAVTTVFLAAVCVCMDRLIFNQYTFSSETQQATDKEESLKQTVVSFDGAHNVVVRRRGFIHLWVCAVDFDASARVHAAYHQHRYGLCSPARICALGPELI